ncbi:MAG: polysaccharide export protein, partial [Pseudomonadota bacterium]
MDTTLQGGDKIFVEEDDRTFLSLGAAGTEAIHPFPTANVSALDALSIVGGLSDERANAKGILILRTYPTHLVTADRSGPDHPRTVFTIDLTSADGLFSAGQFYIEPGDLIYVTESPVVGARSVLALLGSVLGIVN